MLVLILPCIEISPEINPAEGLMLSLTRSLQGSLWAIHGAGLLPAKVHQVAQFQASCALLLNYQE